MIHEPRYDWIDYPDADPGDNLFTWEAEHVGTRIRLFCNPTMAQVRTESKLFTESLGTDLDKQDAYWQYIAPRIPEWNLQYRTEAGDLVDLPAPASDWAGLLNLPFHLAMWIRIAAHLAHLPKVLMRLQNKPGDTVSILSTTPAPANSAT